MLRRKSVLAFLLVSILAKADGKTKGKPAPVPAPASPSSRWTLVGWNDLGMHCMDGKDYSIYSISGEWRISATCRLPRRRKP